MDICTKKYKNTDDNIEKKDFIKEETSIKKNLIKINYPEENILLSNSDMLNEINSVVISCSSNFFENNLNNSENNLNNSENNLNNSENYLENKLKRNNKSIDLLNTENKISKVDDNLKTEDDFFELINILEPTNEYENDINLKNILINFYEREEDIEIKNSINYDNGHFCFYCKNYMVLPEYEIINFSNFHLKQKKYSKYLMLVFRLCPNIFSYECVMENKYLRNYIHKYLNLEEVEFTDPNEKMLKELVIYSQYEIKTKKCDSSHIYENLFHQPNLKYIDYLKCDSCKNYVCPMHIYLSKFNFRDCNICKTKKWSICGWCKYDFNQELACKYIHQKN